MGGKSTVWTDPRYFAFVKEHGPKLGWQSAALWQGFLKAFPEIQPGLTAFRNFAQRVKGGGGITLPEGLADGIEPNLHEAARRQADDDRRRYEQNLLKQLLSEKSQTDQIIGAITDLIPRLPAAKVQRLPAPSARGRTQTGLLLLSDLHVGARVREDETGGFGHYNYDIFKARLNRLRDSVRSITARERQNCKIDHLFVAALGDDVEGDDIFPAQSQMIDMDLMAQVLMCARDQAEFLVSMLDTYQHVTYAKVTGNHGRIGKKGQRQRFVNWDYLIGHMVEMQLREYADRINFLIPKTPFLATEIEGFSFILRHGDGIKSWGGIPWYGLQRSTGRWIAIQAAQQKFFQYMLAGHFHQHVVMPFTGGEVLVNGSFVGTTEFSVEVMESLAVPSQLFCFVHPDYGVAGRYPVLLDRPAVNKAA